MFKIILSTTVLLLSAIAYGQEEPAKKAIGEEYGYDDLQGKCYRGNLRRDAIHKTSGLKALKGVKWKFKTGDKVRSSPVVVDGICYVGSLDKKFYAIDAETGKEKWSFKTGGSVYSSACVYEGYVFFGSDDGYVYGVNCESGELHWKVKMKWKKKNKVRSSPAVAFGMLIVSGGWDNPFDDFGEGGLCPTRGFDLETGKVMFEIDGGGKGFASPAIDGNLISLMQMYGMAYYDLSTGMRKGKKAMLNACQANQASPVMVGDRIFTVMADRGFYSESNRKMMTISRALFDPTIDLQKSTSTAPLTSACYNSTLVLNEVIYVGSDLGKMRTFGTSKNGGSYSKPNRGWTFDAGCKIRSSASTANGVIYFGANDGTIYALPETPVNSPAPKPLWKYKTGGEVYSTVWPGDNVVYVGSDDGFVYCFE